MNANDMMNAMIEQQRRAGLCTQEDIERVRRSVERAREIAKTRNTWEQVSTCLNGPHLWKCTCCSQWTRSFDQPRMDCTLIDPDDGRHYGQHGLLCGADEETMKQVRGAKP